MSVFTAHVRLGRRPVLVPEAFSWGALLFGPLWLLLHRAWLAGVLTLCAAIAVGLLAPPPTRAVLFAGLAWLLGLFGQDLRRWSLGLRGFSLAQVVAAPDTDEAWSRLLDRRPDLVAEALR